jgi:hypothetical protein
VETLLRASGEKLESTPLIEELIPEPKPTAVATRAGTPRAAGTRTAPAPAAAGTATPNPLDFEDAAPRRRPAARAGMPKWVWPVVGGAAALLVAAGAYFALRGGSKPKPPKGPPVAVKGPTDRDRPKDPDTSPTKDPIKDPVKEPMKDPVKDSMKDPMKDPVKDPVKDQVKDPMKVPMNVPVTRAEAVLVCQPDGDPKPLLAVRAEAAKTWQLQQLVQGEAKTVTEFAGHEGPITALVVSADCRRALSGSKDRTVRLWDVHQGTAIRTLEGHEAPIASLAISFDGSRGVSSDGSPVVRVWNLTSGELLQSLAHTAPVTAVGISADGKWVVTGVTSATEPEVLMWEADSGKKKKRCTGNTGSLLCVAVSPSGNIVAAASADKDLMWWTAPVGRAGNLRFVLSAPATGLVFSPDGTRMAAAAGKRVELFLADGSHQSSSSSVEEDVLSVCYIRGGSRNRWVSRKADGGYTFQEALVPAATSPPVVDPPVVDIKPRPKGDNRLPPPTPAEIAAAEKEMRDTYKEDFASIGVIDRSNLAVKLGRDARPVWTKPALYYVYVRESRDLWANAGSPTGAAQQAAALAKRFALDRLEEQCNALELTANVMIEGKNPGRAIQEVSFSNAALPLIKQAHGDEQYGVAGRLIKMSRDVAQKAKNQARVAEINRIAASVESTRKEYERIRQAALTLSAKPDDAAANLAVGSFRCFIKNDWYAGVPNLAQGGDGAYQDLARAELARPANAAALKRLADGWYDQAEKADTTIQAGLRRRAFFWYSEALPGLAGPAKGQAEQRLKSLAQEVPDLDDPRAQLDDSAAMVKADVLRLNPLERVATREAYAGPLDITIVARTAKRLLVVLTDEISFGVDVQRGEAFVFRVVTRMNDGSWSYPNLKKPIRVSPDRWVTLRCRITETDCRVWVDNELVLEDTMVPNDLSIRTVLAVMATPPDGAIDFKSFVVKRPR